MPGVGSHGRCGIETSRYSIARRSGGILAAAKRYHMARSVLMVGVALSIVAALPRVADAQYGQYRAGYGQGYGQGYAPPPCYQVTPGPFAGAARGAAGGALFGAIGGNAGRGAAIGAAIGGVAGAVRRGTARSSGACY